MKSLKITLLLAVLTAVFVLTVSGTSEKNPHKVTQEVKELPSKDLVQIVLLDKKKKNRPAM